ncbi:hypothetical protein HanRHA438_Chr08g0342681 [Helianthus annuus]|nr:hypothetical protein HanRHA438_Chr08g0342681 [Helianthus annuus]
MTVVQRRRERWWRFDGWVVGQRQRRREQRRSRSPPVLLISLVFFFLPCVGNLILIFVLSWYVGDFHIFGLCSLMFVLIFGMFLIFFLFGLNDATVPFWLKHVHVPSG